MTKQIRRAVVPATVFSLAFFAAACGKSEAKSKQSDDQVEVVKSSGPTTAPAKALVSSLAEAAGDYQIDSVHTQVLFRVEHFGVSYQYGRFNKVTGSFSIDKQLDNSKVDIEIAANSVFTADKKRDLHLKSPDFFDAKQFPKITFESKSIEQTGDKTYQVTGELSLRGVDKPVSIELEHIGSGDDPYGNFRTGFEGRFEIKRSDFGMTYMLDGLGDQVTLILAVEAIRK